MGRRSEGTKGRKGLEEALKTARFVHRLMMGISGMLVAFVVTTATSYDYVGAFTLLQTISRQLQIEHAAKYVGLFGRVSLDELELRCQVSTELKREDCVAFRDMIEDLSIGFLPFEEARKELASRSGQDHGVNFLGVQFDRGRVAWAGPLALLLVQAYFLSYLYQLRGCSLPGAHWTDIATSQIKGFPWIILFDTALSGSLAYASIVVLPSLASVLCCIMAEGSVSLSVAIAFSILVGWTCYLAQRAAHVWRQELGVRDVQHLADREM